LLAGYNLIDGFAASSAALGVTRYGRRPLLAAVGLLPIIAYFGMASFLGWGGILFGCLFKVGRGLGEVLLLGSLNERISSAFRATLISLAQMGIRASFCLLGPLVGYGIDAWGLPVDMAAPGRFAALKLVGHETNESIMLFEETVPVGTKSLFHLHRDSDEVAWVLAGEITFKIGDEVTVGGPGTCAFFPRNVPHAWKSTGRETGRVLFMYTPAAAGGYVEELLNHRPINDDERNQLRDRYHWEVVGPNPL